MVAASTKIGLTHLASTERVNIVGQAPKAGLRAGTLDWKRGPTPNIALLRLAGGQWNPGR
ncbi:hypothetical protein GCM10010272_34920 [Streptomyces lateritius]|nr:hypothetical protein GCM10010272_34920 [Streptomyces lateritius]